MQRDEDWFAVRAGKVTASRVSDVVATLKGGKPAASRETYKAQLVVERLTGKCADSYTSSAMQWGIDHEEDARLLYQAVKMCTVELVDFVLHPTISFAGASPDGLVGDDGLVEIKCPNSATHLRTLTSNSKIDKRYLDQMQWQLACTGRQWCDFVSYDPRFPSKLSYKIQRVERDDEYIDHLQDAVIRFLEDVQSDVDALQSLL